MQELRHPRPHFLRDEWQSLDGKWEFEFDDENNGELRQLHLGQQKLNTFINVPFSYQYKASGIEDKKHHEVVWYRKEVEINRGDKNVILGFNASFYETDVWVNGYHVKNHIGGYSAFTIDITKYVKESANVVVVRCKAPLDQTLPRGKQSWTGEPFSCWYIPNSGIWQSVWIDYVKEDYLEDYSIIPNIDDNSFSGELKTKYSLANRIEIIVSHDNKIIKKQSVSLDGQYTRYSIHFMEENFVDEVTYWSVDNPYLYDVSFVVYKDDKELDRVHTKFGMRKISIGSNGQILLNNKPLYQRLVLDQGYWADSGITPPNIDSLKQDILYCKKLGFNGARKHQKIENPYYYRFADELGFLTWCEMPSSYNFNNDEVSYVACQWLEAIKLASKFSSVITYVPFNESWGIRKALISKEQQAFAKSIYHLTKAVDSSRLVSTNDGWENMSESDVISIHDYCSTGCNFAEQYSPEKINNAFQTFRKVMAENNEYKNQPLLLSEFGGISLQSSMKEDCWGYNSAAKDGEELAKRIQILVDEIKKTKFQGFCYTQLSDVQQEVNGFLDGNHQPKFDFEQINKIINFNK